MIISRLSYLALALACVLRWATCGSSAFAYQPLVNDTWRAKQRGSEKIDRNQIDSEVKYNYELEVHFVQGREPPQVKREVWGAAAPQGSYTPAGFVVPKVRTLGF